MIKEFKVFQKIFEAWYDDNDYDQYYDQDYYDYDYNDEQYNDNDDDDVYHTYDNRTILSSFNVPKLSTLGLIEYRDIVVRCLSWFEKQIAAGSYGRVIIPPLEVIIDYIISEIGNDYREYISEENLDQLSRYIYQEIDKYVFD